MALPHNTMDINLVPDPLVKLIGGKTVSIVGNAGSLLLKPTGPIIDDSDLAMRFGEAPISGYEKHVGTLQGIYVTNSHFLLALTDSSIDAHMKNYFPNFNKFFYSELKGQLILVKNSPGVPIRPAMNTYIEDIRKHNVLEFIPDGAVNYANSLCGKNCTCGFLGILLASACASKINCFGFNFYDCPDEDRHYYQTSEQPKEQQNSIHNFSNEKKLAHSLNPDIINFH
jgi:hypothetical protein